jgi:SAM-dependent methyltransferase
MKLCLACGQRFEGDDWRCPGCGQGPDLRHGHLSFAPDLAESSGGFDAEYFTPLAKLEAGHFWFRSRNRLLIWALRRYFPHASSLLEIGCGTGYVLAGIQRELPDLLLCGSEIFSEGLSYAEERLPGVTLLQMDARHIPFEGEFDVIGAFDVLEHVEDDETVLQQMYRATKPGGGTILTVPQHRSLWSIVDEYSFHQRRYTRRELAAKVERAGFEVIRATSFVSLLLPLMLLSRVNRRKSEVGFDPVAELEVDPILNLILEKVLGIERTLIRKGLSFPVGGSLLVVAER